MDFECTICSKLTSENTRFQIYTTGTPYSKKKVVDMIKNTLNLTQDVFESDYICNECYDIFLKLDAAEQSCLLLRDKIFVKNLFKTGKNNPRNNNNGKSTNDKECFTSNVAIATSEKTSSPIKVNKKPVNNIQLNKVTTETQSNKVTTESQLNTKPVNVESLEAEVVTKPITEDKVRRKFSWFPKHMCQPCKKRFKNKKGLLFHNLIKHKALKNGSLASNKPVEPAPAPAPVSIHALAQTTTEQLTFSCTKCNTQFTNFEDLNKHTDMHSKIDKVLCYICDICGEVCKYKNLLNIHKTMYHAPEKKKKVYVQKKRPVRRKYFVPKRQRGHLKSKDNEKDLIPAKQICEQPKINYDVQTTIKTFTTPTATESSNIDPLSIDTPAFKYKPEVKFEEQTDYVVQPEFVTVEEIKIETMDDIIDISDTGTD